MFLNTKKYNTNNNYNRSKNINYSYFLNYVRTICKQEKEVAARSAHQQDFNTIRIARRQGQSSKAPCNVVDYRLDQGWQASSMHRTQYVEWYGATSIFQVEVLKMCV